MIAVAGSASSPRSTQRSGAPLQVVTGRLSDHAGRKPLITLGMLVQAAALAVLVAGGGAFAPAVAAAALLGSGTALVYPILIAAVSDVAQPRDRAPLVGGVPPLARLSFVAGALLVGFAADALGAGVAVMLMAVLTAASGLIVAATPWTACPDRIASADGRHRQLPEVKWRSRSASTSRSSSAKSRRRTPPSQEPERDFVFPTGRAWAEDLGYPPELAHVPDAAVASFAGVVNPWQLGSAQASTSSTSVAAPAPTSPRKWSARAVT